MINFKKIGIGLCMSAIGAAMMTTTVCAQTLNKKADKEDVSVIVTNSENTINKQNTGFHGDDSDYIKLKDECIVGDSKNYYDDTYIQDIAQEYKDAGFYVFDLKGMADYLNEGLTDDEGHMFVKGFVAKDKYKYATYNMYVCKCNKYELDSFVATFFDDYDIDDNFWIMKNANYTCTISYNPTLQVLTFTEKY